MWQAERKQRSFAEQTIVNGGGRNAQLARIDGLIQWGAIERELEQVHAAKEGRPAYRPLLLFKALLLQQWYQLSDPGLEEALADRLSFRRMAGLRLEQAVPDHSTLSRFRAQLAAQGLGERLFGAVNRQLEQRGLMLKRGSILDATVVAASVQPPRGAPGGHDAGQGSALDPDAQWGQRKDGPHTHSHFGYKAHVGVDESSGLVRKAVMTGAKVNESVVADRLISGDEACVYADKAYDSAARRQLLARLGIADGIMRRAPWGSAHHPPPALAARNQVLAKTRFAVERTFAVMKRWYGFRRVRYRGLARNGLQLYLLCIALNLRRALKLGAA
jgi:IS5 family transposase